MAITTTEQAVAAIKQFANGTALLTTVTELAEFFKQTVFQSTVRNTVAGGVVNNYLVGTKVVDAVGTKSLRFTTYAMRADVTPEFEIPSVLIVAVINASNLNIAKKTTLGIERLESILFPPEVPTQETKTWTQLDLGNATPPRIVLTTQLSGCTFAIGSVRNHVYMGHGQPNKQVKYAKDGKELAKGLAKGKCFDGLLEALESTFLIDEGDTNSSSKDVDYGDAASFRANVLGVVQGRELFFIVAIVPAYQTSIVQKVFTVNWDASRQWTCALQ